MINEEAVTKLLETTVASMRTVFQNELRNRIGKDPESGPSPTFAILCTVNPLTGEPIAGEYPMPVIVNPTGDWEEAERESMALQLRLIALAGEAVAFAHVLDCWLAIGDAAEEANRVKRSSIMVLGIERRGQPTQLTCTAYQQVGDELEFTEAASFSGAEIAEARFTGVLPPEHMRTPERIAKARAFLQKVPGVSFREVGEVPPELRPS